MHSIPIDLIPINIALYRVNDDGDFIFIDLNTQAQETEKISKEEVQGRKVTEVFPGIKEMGLLDVFNRVFVSGVSEVFDSAHYRDERIFGWRKNTVTKLDEHTLMAAYEDGEVLKKLETQINEKADKLNITTHKLQEQNKTLLLAQKIAKLGTWALNLENNQLIWDDETYNIFDIDHKGSIATVDDFFAAIHPQDVERVHDAYNHHLNNQTPYTIVHRLKTKAGTIKYVEERCETVFDDDGTPRISYGTIQDFTTVKKQEIALHKKDILLMQQYRLAQMGKMLSMIAHQWRQPLSRVTLQISNLQLKEMLGTELTSSEVDNAFNFINDTMIHLSETIDDFRNFYKHDKKVLTLKLEDVISKSLNVIKGSLISENIKIIQEYNSQEEIELHDNEMMHVILNILKNAEDNFKEKHIENPYIKISTKNRTICISDNGGGIPEEIIEKIFDPYFTTKDEKNGTGLGLYMSKTIIEEHHNGKLYAKNVDDGVCFVLELGIISTEQETL